MGLPNLWLLIGRFQFKSHVNRDSFFTPIGRNKSHYSPDYRNLIYDSSCTICNPATRKTNPSQEDEQKVREGIYYGETSRTLMERSQEHYRDAASFSKKSHIIKHWMSGHSGSESSNSTKIACHDRWARPCGYSFLKISC